MSPCDFVDDCSGFTGQFVDEKMTGSRVTGHTIGHLNAKLSTYRLIYSYSQTRVSRR